MKALSLLVVLYLHACLSSGQQWTGYQKTYPKTKYSYLGPHYPRHWGQKPRPSGPLYVNNYGSVDGVFSPRFLPFIKLTWPKILSDQIAKKTFIGNEILRNNGIQNNSGFNGRRAFGDDVQIQQGDKRINNNVLVVNKTNEGGPRSIQSYTSTLTANLPGGGNSRYWINENDENTRESYLLRPRPVWDQRIKPLPVPYNPLPLPVPYNPRPLPVPVNPYDPLPVPDDSYDPGFPEDNFHPNECYNLLEVIKELRLIIRSKSIVQEKYNLKKLIRLIRIFIEQNNLQHSSFRVVVREMERALLRANNDVDLAEEEIVQILQQFKNGDMLYFLLEIRSNPNISISVVLSKLVQLLQRLKAVLIQRRVSQESIRLVINRAVQWSVPLVGYSFERECKIKTQQYIVKNLQAALQINLEDVQHVQSIDEFPTGTGLEESEYLGGLGKLGHTKNYVWASGSQGNIAGLGGLSSDAGSWSSVDSGYAGGLGGLGNQGNLGDLEGVGSVAGKWTSLDSENAGGLGNQGGFAVQGTLGGLGGLGSQLNLGGQGDLKSQGNYANLREAENLLQSGAAVGLESRENINNSEGSVSEVQSGVLLSQGP